MGWRPLAKPSAQRCFCGHLSQIHSVKQYQWLTPSRLPHGHVQVIFQSVKYYISFPHRPQLSPQGDVAVFGGFFVCVAPYTVHSHYDMETATVFALQTTSEPGVSSSLMSPVTADSGAHAQNKRSVFPAATIKCYCD